MLPKTVDHDLDDIPAAGLKFASARRSDFEAIKKAGKWQHAIRAYLTSISYADAQLGRVLDALEKSSHANNTVIVLWSDHGWHLGEKEHWHKTTLWEEATRVPLIIRAAGYSAGTCTRPVSLLDLYPTLHELCRLKQTRPHDGVSLTPLLRNPQASWHRPAVTEYKRGNAAVRSERYRYIRYRDGSEELYDHQVDPEEWNNLAGQEKYSPIKLELRGWITKDWAPSALSKQAFRFDPATFSWTHKQTGRKISGK